jgi:hypothetical protein
VTCSLETYAYFKGNDTSYLFRYTVLIYDASSLIADRPQYKFEGFMQDFSTGYYLYFYSNLNLSHEHTDYLSGLKDITFYNSWANNFVWFQTAIGTNSIQSYFSSHANYLAASYFAAAYFSCPGPLYILNVTNQSCQNPFECDDTAMYYNYSNGLCQPCHPLCLTCFTENECLSCNASLFR